MLLILPFLSTLTLVLATPHPYPPTPLPWHQTTHIIAFGDSYTYIQGLHGRQNYSFIGDQQNFSFNASTLLSNRIVQNQTATAEGGPNWLEFLTGCGVRRGLTDPRKCTRQLWDFAFADADISAEYAETPLHHEFTVSFVRQVEQFRLYGSPVLGGYRGEGGDFGGGVDWD
ncbi:hypothetical protein CLAFUW4_06381 [Fulvia fulva]|uniref:Carbohydrate esterase family 16 protein n=1 Tax=Passalora fulva TaxID=5499 RepID=A0A9Q8LJJ5_PASFU|nr:uncharacterized protein CLAFUR5_06525 [Fulvia fulva]KAK4624115.1 hypothetical protein CLAFUR4_06384 [Fulvia fulva]KAK4625520.1 hypothetical protein CLAFUR0_06385 [Fulvia fulva]UJO17798.1 hypothetical protein CLAFUR5_06525 [Fulvia fulva]WPV14641.1 hypothetical protein CLAFUW4_06381 [Fulvia fulva]WPV29690.1 hypothetical protein CLAFUW7_06379 [Fulvia fulva]